MQKLAASQVKTAAKLGREDELAKPPSQLQSNCVLLKNVVSPAEVDDSLEAEIRDEAEKFGPLEKVISNPFSLLARVRLIVAGKSGRDSFGRETGRGPSLPHVQGPGFCSAGAEDAEFSLVWWTRHSSIFL